MILGVELVHGGIDYTCSLRECRAMVDVHVVFRILIHGAMKACERWVSVMVRSDYV